MRELGKVLLIAGVALAATGALLLAAGRLPWLGKLGNLPGDVVLRRGSFTFYFPIVTCIVVSLLLTLLLRLFLRR